MDALPHELLSHIALKLLFISPTSLPSLVMTCHRIYDACIHILYARPLVPTSAHLPRLLVALSSQRYASLLKRINLAGFHVDDQVIRVLMGCTRLERVGLSGCICSQDVLAQAVVCWRGLVTLDVSDAKDAVTDVMLVQLGRYCEELRYMYASGAANITTLGVTALAKGCRKLRRLKLNQCEKLDDGIAEPLSTLVHLTELDLDGCILLSPTTLSTILPHLNQLRELHVSSMPSLTDAVFAHVVSPAAFLRVVFLSNSPLITDHALHILSSHVPRLRQLDVSKCPNISDAGVISTLPKWSKTLQHLHLGHCTRITDASLHVIARMCPRLRYLDLGCCARITDQGVGELRRLTRLKRLGLVRCVRLTDKALEDLLTPIALPSCMDEDGDGASLFLGDVANTLERAHLSYCVRFTLSGILQFLQRVPRLTHLSLTGVPVFLRPDVQRFSRNPPNELSGGQRLMFCVVSGASEVAGLRRYLESCVYEERRMEGMRVASVHIQGLGPLPPAAMVDGNGNPGFTFGFDEAEVAAAMAHVLASLGLEDALEED